MALNSVYSALEMIIKMCDHDFFRKSRAADVFSKVYDLFLDVGVGCGDKVRFLSQLSMPLLM